jgi:DNA-binding CsgD family transcriptional regulator
VRVAGPAFAAPGVAAALARAGVHVAAGSNEAADVLVVVGGDAAQLAAASAGVPQDTALLWLSDSVAAPPAAQRRAFGHFALPEDTPAGSARLLAAVQALAQGFSLWPGPVPRALVDAEAAASAPGVFEEALTPRELEVFELMAKGLANREIAAALGITAHTAKFHVAQILDKTGAATRTEAVRQGLRRGWVGL